MKLKLKVKLMGQHGDEVLEMKTLYYDYGENITFGNVFEYVNREMNLSEREYFPTTLGKNLEQKILKAQPGKITENDEIDWDFDLRRCKVSESLEAIGLDSQNAEIEVICVGAIGSGGGDGSLTLEDVKLLIQIFGSILAIAVNLFKLPKAIESFKNFLEKNKDVTEERITKTIKQKTTWKKGFSSKSKFKGQDIVEESIMTYAEYRMDKRTKKWTDRNMG